MSSLLNVFNNSSRPEEFSIKDIEMLVDNKKQNWFKRVHVGKFLGLVHIHRSTARLVDEDQKTRAKGLLQRQEKKLKRLHSLKKHQSLQSLLIQAQMTRTMNKNLP